MKKIILLHILLGFALMPIDLIIRFVAYCWDLGERVYEMVRNIGKKVR